VGRGKCSLLVEFPSSTAWRRADAVDVTAWASDTTSSTVTVWQFHWHTNDAVRPTPAASGGCRV
jgi:hypothetical protein